MSINDEVAVDLGCERCARIYLAIFRNQGVSWLEKIVVDTKMRHRAVRRHLKRLLVLKLVAAEPATLYKISREIDSVKRLRNCENLDCDGCGRVYLALLRSGGIATTAQIMREARMTRHTVKKHLRHLMDCGLVDQKVLGMFRLKKER